jgi:hypothetical protein
VTAMSALGQKQTSDCHPSMSALPPKADIGAQPSDVRAISGHGGKFLFDHLVGELLQGRWYFEAECFRGF